MYFNIFFLFIIIRKLFASPICKNNENYCNKCNPLTNLCIKCEIDILTPDKNGGCIGIKKCILGDNYCDECDNDGILCKKCENGYFPDKNGGCSYTDNCKLSYDGECLECDMDYILIGNNSEYRRCKYINSDDLQNCKEINLEKGICQGCEKGYYLNSKDKKCIKTQNCKKSKYGNCILCDTGFYLSKKENLCINKTETDSKFLTYCDISLDGIKCDICNEYSYLSEDGICVLTNYCSESKNEKCTKCINNYFLSKNLICTSTENCKDADKDTGLCNICDDNFYLDTKDYKCKSNQEDNDYKYCKKAIEGKCSECINIYKLTQDFKCIESKHCLESENGKCILCEEDYHLGLDNICTNITHCVYSNYYNNECLECEEDYYYNKLYKNCSESNELFKNCKYSEGFGCCECKDNYYLDLNNSKCVDNTEEGPFYKCAFGYSEYCNECINGYYLGSGDKKCSLIEDCKKSKDENTCIECEDSMCLDVKKGICVDSMSYDGKNKFYINCKKTNKEGTACEECIEDIEVGEDGNCINLSKCIEKNNDECLKCSQEPNDEGFTYCANKIYGCILHPNYGCLRCDDLSNLYNCTECIEGYKKIGNYYYCAKIVEE